MLPRFTPQARGVGIGVFEFPEGLSALLLISITYLHALFCVSNFKH